MTLSTKVKRLGLNMLKLLFVMFPIWYCLMWLIERAVYGPLGGSLIGMLAFNWVTASLPLLGGGILHEALLWAVSGNLPSSWRRVFAVVSTVLIPVVIIAVDVHPDRYFKWQTLGPLLLGLLVYGLIVRLPERVVGSGNR